MQFVVQQAIDDASKWSVYRKFDDALELAIPGVRFDTEHRAQLVAVALEHAYSEGINDADDYDTGPV